VRKALSHVPQVSIESVIGPLVFPVGFYLLLGVAKDRTEPVLYPDSGAEFLSYLVNAYLGDIGPNAEQVGKICYFDFAHPKLKLTAA
jgi:hypothetical protein